MQRKVVWPGFLMAALAVVATTAWWLRKSPLRQAKLDQRDKEFTGAFPVDSGAVNAVIGGNPEDMNEMPTSDNFQRLGPVFDGSDLSRRLS